MKLEKKRLIHSKSFYSLSGTHYVFFKGHKKYDQEVIIDLIHNLGYLSLEFIDHLGQINKIDNPGSDIYTFKLIKGAKSKLIIKTKQARGNYKVYVRTIYHIPVTFEMNLNPGPFNLIKNHQKVIEMRLFDERRKNIKPGDYIKFKNTETGDEMTVIVKKLKRFKNFEALYRYFDKRKLGYTKNQKADPKDMLQYYSQELIDKYGTLAIYIAFDK